MAYRVSDRCADSRASERGIACYAPSQPEAARTDASSVAILATHLILSGYRRRLVLSCLTFSHWLGSVSLELRHLLCGRRDLALARCPQTRRFAAQPVIRATSLNAVQGTPWRRR